MRKLRMYLIALDGDEIQLKVIWARAESEHYSVNDSLALLECFAHVQTHDQEVINDVIAVFETDMLFGAKYDMMVSLAQIGPVAGLKAAETIRRTMTDTQPWVIATRDRVVERLEATDEWTRCGDCCFGRIHDADGYGERPCPRCLGISYIPSPIP